MTEQHEFLEKLKHPNREPIERDIKRFCDKMIPEGIIEMHVNRDKGSRVHAITITTDDGNRFLTLDLLFFDVFPRDYAHGTSTRTNVAEGPEIKNHVLTYEKMYIIREYL